jgi:glycosyltransferase involved in cell wall biosynthesis
MTATTIVAVSFGLSIAFDVLLYSVRPLWRFRILLSLIVLAATAFSMPALLLSSPSVWSGLFVLVGAYRIFATLRITEGRIQELYLRKVARRSAFILILCQCALLLAAADSSWHHVSEQTIGNAVTSPLFVSSVLLLAATMRRYSKTKWPLHVKHYVDSDLPSITVAIPARNETEDLQACLESLVASNYPKLEVIVYDDCSQERRTPEIIRDFAHDGVRFINGQEPIDSWLAKNTAYDRLYKESNGEYIVFSGVDVRFGPDSLTRLISFMKSSKKQMVSVLPRRDQSVYGRFSLIQAMRYWWELAPPRRFFSRPPVMGSCWAIERNALKKVGAFAAVSRSVVPEAYFARQLLVHDHYSFRRADQNLGIVSAKLAAEQRDTAVRVRYPQVHRRPEIVMIVACLELVLLVSPYLLLIFGSFLNLSATSWLRLSLSCIFLSADYIIVAVSTQINRWWFAVIGLPFVVLTDIGLLHYSMWRYEFSTVDWKGRNVCVPTMHVTAHLPKLTD